jgi:predicted nuclease with RNAse H fold
MPYLLLPPPQPSICVGIDLAGLPHRETGVAVLRDGYLERLVTAGDDDEIMALAALAGPTGTVAINAPLTLPRGRCCLDDDCPCRHDPGTRSREIERELLRMRIPVLATALIKVLARRGILLSAALRAVGCVPLEVYPYATLRLLDLPAQGKRTQLGRRRIHHALQPLVPGLDHPDASEHQLDAIVCALTAELWRAGQTRTVGVADEGLMVIPRAEATVPAAVVASVATPLRRVAEPDAAYNVDEAPTSSSEPA